MTIKIDINDAKILEKVKNDRFGLFVAHEWKRLIDPYTPRNTGVLMGITGQTVDVTPWELWYKSNYAEKVYYGYEMNFRKINPYSTYEWDIKAEQAGQKDKLYRTLNNALQSGQF